MKASLLTDPLPNHKVRCNVCAVRCIIPEGNRGVCRTRLNRQGTLYTLIYGLTSGACADPIEKKPLFHFYPGTQILSMGTRGCNFRCPGCQNWNISHDAPDEFGRNMEALDPVESARLARKLGCQGIGWTYNDPTIWLEHTLEAMTEAKKLGLYSAYITNGYATPEHMDLIGPYLTAWRVDLKGFSRESYKKISGLARFDPTLEMTKLARHTYDMWVECVTNVTPTVNDDEETAHGIARWIRDSLGPLTPWHVTRFHPYLELSHLPSTPIETLERFVEIAREEGLKYVYVGNVPDHPLEDTYCHGCGMRVIQRRRFAGAKASLVDGKCPKCATQIPGRFQMKIDPTTGERRPILFS
ncbi:MAG: AmmeMemoRadiSam system radical SAM enzyme [Planctomycetes bacterium]|nr:AmmeMemoRadiSam system radical SAM enzyme [Planctomycetota bacterium]